MKEYRLRGDGHAPLHDRKSNAESPSGSVLVRAVPCIGLVCIFLLVWEGVSRLLNVPAYVLPAPSLIVLTMIGNAVPLTEATLDTLVESLAGFLLALVAAVAGSILIVEWPLASRALKPYLGILQAIPLVAVAPLIILWFGTGGEGRIILAALVAVFPLLTALITGFRSVVPDAADLFRLHDASVSQRYRYLLIPNALPYLLAGSKTSLSLSLVGAIVAEFLIPVRGLGKTLVLAGYGLDAPLMFAAVVASSLLAVLYLAAVSLVERILIHWHPSQQADSVQHSRAGGRT